MGRLTCVLFLTVTLAVLLSFVHHADAYQRYNDGCKDCHGAFTDSTTTRGSGFKNNNKLEMHRSPYEMGTKCKLCHTNGDNRNPYLGSSTGTSDNPGLGCVGCHGREEDAGNDSLPGGRGAGLRQHHWFANRIVNTANGPVSSRVCGDCHSDSNPSHYTPVGEHVKPVYFGTIDTGANEPCNPIPQQGINENWGNNDFRGLDNDGDGLFDLNDPDCGGLQLCVDIDNDGYINCDGTCAPGTLLCGDCNTSDPTIYPGATEGPAGTAECNDSLDNDCDGDVDSADVECTSVNYETYIQPVWDNDCISCHGSVNPKANLDISPGVSCDNLHNGGYIVPGDSASSLLYQKLITGSMKQKISPANRDMVGAWIDLGAICGGPGTCTDNDFDGYGNPGDSSCANGAAQDCNDSDPTIYPGAPEGPAGTATCNDALDNDCDGYTDSADVECSVVNYENDIQPIWDNDCISCHGSVDPKANLDISSGVSCDNLHNGGYIVPGDSASSILYQKLTTGSMKQKTSPSNKDRVASWIEQGAICGGPGTCTDNDFDGYGNPGDPSCANGAAQDCNDSDPGIYPGALELCDGLDNDCDSTIDEDFPGLGTACTAGTGECESTGNYVCTADGLGTECNAAPLSPGTEGPAGDVTCSDTIDNDCDGQVDSIDPDCYSCVPTGTPETMCNGVDDDCDGAVDEDYISTSTLCGVGGCASTGQSTCVDGVEGDTCTPGTPSAEICDGFDNDCDSSIDEDFPNLGTACTAGIGACEASGTYICTTDGLGTECDATPGTPGIEGPGGDPTCSDTIDNDCDGLTDGGDIECGAYTVPPVRQEIGRPDSAYNDLVETDCRFCHENPDQFPVDPESVPDRHHLIYGTLARVGTCSQTDTVQCQEDADCPIGETCSNGSDAPFPPPVGGNYDCFTCHDADCGSGDCSVIVFRDCLICHIQGPAEYTVHHRTDLALGNLPQGPDCVACHGDLVNNRDDGHIISTSVPTQSTPKRSGGTGLPFNNRGNGAGACNYCHDDGTSVEGIVVETNMITHHNRGFGFDDTKCDWCHDFTLPFEEQIRICENCHGYTSLHNIQADSDGDGVINPGIEQPFYGHIGNPDDCWGCHGYGPASIAPGSDAVIPSITSTSHSVLTEGVDTAVTLYGAAFTNMNEGVELTSDVVLTAEDGSSTTLTPDTITQDTITVTIPGTLSTGNYRIQAAKQNKLSNPKVISVKPVVHILDVSCDRKKRIMIVNGSGFSEKIEGTDQYISLKIDGHLTDIISWTDTQIKVSVGRCSKRVTVTVNSLFGSDTLNTNKKYGR